MLFFRFLPDVILSRSALCNMTSARNDFGYRKSLSRVLKDMSSEQQNAVKKDRYSDELDVKHSQTQLVSTATLFASCSANMNRGLASKHIVLACSVMYVTKDTNICVRRVIKLFLQQKA